MGYVSAHGLNFGAQPEVWPITIGSSVRALPIGKTHISRNRALARSVVWVLSFFTCCPVSWWQPRTCGRGPIGKSEYIRARYMLTLNTYVLVFNVINARYTGIWVVARWIDNIYIIYSIPRALSLRNLVLGYGYGRVFPAGVGPPLPSKDAANWLSSWFSRSVETRRRYGCRGWCSQARATSEFQFGALREVAARERQWALSRRVW